MKTAMIILRNTSLLLFISYTVLFKVFLFPASCQVNRHSGLTATIRYKKKKTMALSRQRYPLVRANQGFYNCDMVDCPWLVVKKVVIGGNTTKEGKKTTKETTESNLFYTKLFFLEQSLHSFFLLYFFILDCFFYFPVVSISFLSIHL